jgi:hypothetical protein
MRSLLLIVILFATSLFSKQGFSQNEATKYQYAIVVQNSGTLAQQKICIDILKEVLNNPICVYDVSTNSFIISTDEFYDVNELKTKINTQNIILVDHIKNISKANSSSSQTKNN